MQFSTDQRVFIVFIIIIIFFLFNQISFEHICKQEVYGKSETNLNNIFLREHLHENP